MKKIKKIGALLISAFLFLCTTSLADTIDPALENRRMRELNDVGVSAIDGGDVLKITIIGILVVILIAIVAFTIYKIVKTKNENK